MRGPHAPREHPGIGLMVLGIGFAAGYWIVASAAQTFIFQHGSFLSQLLSRDATDLSGRLVAVSFLVAMGVVGGRKRAGNFMQPGGLPPPAPAAAHRWSDSAVRTLHESEERYRTLVENIDIGITLIDRNYSILMTNAAMGEFFHKPVCEFVGRRCYAEFEKRTDVCPHCPGKAAMRSGRPAEVETLGVRDDGTSFPARIRAFPMKGPDGAANGFIEVVQDITRQRQAQESLQRSEERFRSLCQFAPIGIFVTDQAGDCTYVNNCLQKIAGLTLDESLGMQWTRLIHPDDREDMLTAVAQTIQTGSEFSRECRIVTSAGEVKQLAIRAAWLRDAQGARLGQVGAIEDITDRKQAEEELRNFKTICDRTPHGCAIADVSGKLLYVNAAFAKMHGYTPPELLGQPLSMLHSQAQMPEVNRLLERLTGEGQFVSEEVWHKRRDGSVFPTLTDAAVIADASGKPLFFSGMAVDISERKQIEATLRRQSLVFESINDGVIITDREGRITDWNPGAERIFDYFKGEVFGKSPEMLNPPEQAPLVTENIRLGMERDGYWCGDIDFVRKDGTEGICEAFLVPIRDEGGEWIGTVAVNRDVTARKLAEEEKARMEAQLHHTQKLEAVGTLASGIAHDFNNLLTAIFGYAALARDSLPTEHAARRSLDMIEQAGKQARGVISSLLTFSQKEVPKRSPINLTRSLTEAQQLLRRLLPAAIEIEEETPPGTELWVNGDSTQLQQVWINLAINARDAMPNGGRLKISLSRQTPQAGEPHPGARNQETAVAVVVVEDCGVGMPAEVRAKAFDPFFTTKPREQGTGLGLAVSHAIVTRHDGTIVIDSEEGRGTRVTVSLPCCPRPAVVADASLGAAARAGQGETIVVVEDDEHVRSILVSSLRSQGYDVLFAADGEEAMKVFGRRAREIRLVVLDLDVPKASGAGILRQTLDVLPEALVLVVTGRIDWNPERDAYQRQVLLRKPFTILELNEQVARLVCESAERRESKESA